MLTQMRALSQNWIGRSIMAVVLGFIIVSFAVWGIGDRFSHFNASELARVGTERISVDQYRRAYQNQLQQMQQREKRGITNDEARRMGLDRQVLYGLLRDAVLDQEAAKLGLAVSDEAVAKSITEDDAFKGPTGRFDRMRFLQIMQANNMSEASYVRQQRGFVLREAIAEAVVGGLPMPKVLEHEIHRYQAEVRDVDFFVLPPTAAGTAPTPTEADLKTFYDQHATSFVAPEYRKLVVLSIVPANLVKPDAVTDDDVKKRYEEMKAVRFSVPEKRTVEQLVFPDAKAAEAAKAKLDGGESFEKLVADMKKTPADIGLGTVAKGELNDTAVSDAAFALPAGGTSKPVKAQFGTVLVHVSKITPGHEQPLIEVSALLHNEIAIIRANREAKKIRDKIEDQRASGKTLTEAAATVGLKPMTIDAIDAQGRDKAHKPIEGLVEGPKLLKSAFATDVGADTEMISGSAGGDVWYEVGGIVPSHQLPLAEVKPRVAAGWQKAQVAKKLSETADKLVAELGKGKTLEAAAKESGNAQLLEITNLTRQGGPNVPPIAAGPMFDVNVGKVGATAGPGDGRIIFKVKAARVPPLDPKDEEFAKLMDQVKAGTNNDVLAEFLAEAQKEVGVQINQRALQSALGEDPNNS